MSSLPPTVTEDFHVPHDGGAAGPIDIYVRNVRPQGVTKFSPDRIVILQHGATYSSTAFDVPFAGLSWMQYLAQRGFDAYCLDLPGYGRSTRPALMDAPPDANPPYLRTPDAVRALASVVEHVRRRRAVDQLNLIGWSWGTTITASFTADNPDKIARLALFAPVWDRRNSPSPIAIDGPIGAYRIVSRKDAYDRKMAGVPDGKRDTLSPPGWFEQWRRRRPVEEPLLHRHQLLAGARAGAHARPPAARLLASTAIPGALPPVMRRRRPAVRRRHVQQLPGRRDGSAARRRHA